MLLNYFVSNFALLCISVAMFFIIIYNVRGQARENHYSIAIIVTALVLSVLTGLENWGRNETLNIFWTTFVTALGYIIRPICVYFFIQLVGRKMKYDWILILPLVFNAIVYLLSLFINVDAMRYLVFYYTQEGDALVHHRGYLNFTAHTISAIYVAYFLILAFKGLKGKHKTDSIVLFVCSLFALGAVILEALSVSINLLNVTIAISCLFYYLYLYVQHTRRDPLTGLFDRKSFYGDVEKFGKSINGVVNIDMNGLKLINDKLGHLEGDKAIYALSQIIEKCAKKNSYVYRLGGDEFTILVVNGTLKDVEETASDIKEALKETKYTVSIGYAYTEDKTLSLEELAKIADEQMYIDKENFYKSGKMERRHSR